MLVTAYICSQPTHNAISRIMSMTRVREIGAENTYQETGTISRHKNTALSYSLPVAENSVPNCMSDTPETCTGFLVPVFWCRFRVRVSLALAVLTTLLMRAFRRSFPTVSRRRLAGYTPLDCVRVRPGPVRLGGRQDVADGRGGLLVFTACLNRSLATPRQRRGHPESDLRASSLQTIHVHSSIV